MRCCILLLALGLVVDDPITNVDNIQRHILARKRNPLQATLFAVDEVLPPVIDVVAAMNDDAPILHDEPAKISGIKTSIPPQLQRIVDRCLQKDPKQRLRDIGEARIAFEGPLKKGANTRKAGEDVAAGEAALPAGRRLGPPEIAEIEPLTHDVSAFRFELPSGAALDILPGDHMMMHGWFLSRSTMRSMRSRCAFFHSGLLPSVTSGRYPIPCDSMFASSMR